MLSDDRSDKKLDFLVNQCRLLMESFDTVQIFASKRDAESTHTWHHGDGNYYARYGHVKQWVIKEENEIKEQGKG